MAFTEPILTELTTTQFLWQPPLPNCIKSEGKQTVWLLILGHRKIEGLPHVMQSASSFSLIKNPLKQISTKKYEGENLI
jgi:hypothetical protein